MIVVILLLAFDVAVHNDMTVGAEDLSGLEADWTNGKVGSNIFTDGYLVRHQALIVTCIGLSSKIHQEFGDILCSSHCCAVQWRVSILVSYVRSCPIVQEQLQYFVLRVMSSCFQ